MGKKPAPLSQLLKGYLAAAGLDRSRARRELEEGWVAVVGPEVARHSRLVGHRQGVLQVEVDSAPLMQELATFGEARIVKDLQARVGTPIRSLRVRLGVFDGPSD